MVLTSVPPVPATASRSDAKWSRRSLSAAASPISDANSVEPTRSVKRMVIRPPDIAAQPSFEHPQYRRDGFDDGDRHHSGSTSSAIWTMAADGTRGSLVPQSYVSDHPVWD